MIAHRKGFNFSKWCWAMVSCFLFGGANLHAQVVINEVMFDPAGTEFFDEYIELYHTGDVAIDLTGWRVGDGDATDAIIPVTQGLLLKPGQFALILDADYFALSTRYHPLPQDALVVTIDDPTFGNGGLNNGVGERVVLISAVGDTVASMMYQAPNTPDFSEEKIYPLGGDAVSNWANSKWAGGTPGRVNSVSVKPVDLALHTKSDSVFVPWMQKGVVELWAVNVGQEAIHAFQVRLNGLSETKVQDGGALGVGESKILVVDMGVLPSGVREVVAEGVLVGDEDVHNQVVKWTVLSGYAPHSVVINEVMVAPREGGEWVELLGVSDAAIDLSGWQLSDGRTDGIVAMGEIDGQGRVILAEMPEMGITLSRWPRLNNGGDVLRLRDATGSVIDSIAYPMATTGVSLERIDAHASGMDHLNWMNSIKGATPNQPNSVAVVKVDSVRLVVDPNPFAVETRITYHLPVSRAFVDLFIFDQLGRKVRSLLVAKEGGAVRDVVWDGRSDHQQLLKPGVFVLYLEARSALGQVYQAKTPVVLSRGISN